MAQIYDDISGLLLLDKPSNITSFKVAHRIKRILNVKKAGHCGTLDPAATGLLLILVGKATKLQDRFMKKDKVYISSFLLGMITDSGDLDGNIVSRSNISNIDIKVIKALAKTFKGEVFQTPPMYSALKYNGKKLYEFARQGVEIERKSREIMIKRFDILSYNDGIVRVRIECSSGTYIRTLAQDLGNVLKCGATVKMLRREKIGIFDVKDALKFEEADSADKIIKNLIPFKELLSISS
ncbi:MAG: tRNA pseudouridine(55) synthase TruB [Endomicrobium sp.]|jgi:tRNA pseudouridine55 synthase|nr:tRNA pseudouridine(55) synthase TruB [Endomicrobium sp.]